nr:hypothetical protein [Kibdelosporangium sp. MJ126-NF4]
MRRYGCPGICRRCGGRVDFGTFMVLRPAPPYGADATARIVHGVAFRAS